MEIPKGARHLLIQAFQGTPDILGKRSRSPPGGAGPSAAHPLENLLFLAAALKNQETDRLFLNHEDELPESRVVIEKGAAWEYANKEGQQSVQTRGPLTYGVLLMVSATVREAPPAKLRPNRRNHCLLVGYKVHSHGESKVTVSYKYIIQNRLWSSLESNLVQEDTILYEWALKKWSHCSKPCGGGLNRWLSSQ